MFTSPFLSTSISVVLLALPYVYCISNINKTWKLKKYGNKKAVQ
jgi:hypothetical protein